MMRIRLIVLAVLSICLMPFLIGQIVLALNERDEALRGVETGMWTSIGRARDFLVEAQRDIENIASILAIRNDMHYMAPTECSETLTRVKALYERVDHISILASTGGVFCSTSTAAIGARTHYRGTLIPSLLTPGIEWGEVQKSAISKSLVISAARPVRRDGKLEYVILVALNVQSLKNQTFSLFDVGLSRVLLLGERGQIADDDTFDRAPDLIDTATAAKSKSVDFGVIRPEPMTADSHFVGVVKLPMNNARALFSTPVKAVFEEARQKLIGAIITAVIEVVVFAGITMAAIEFFFLRSLRRISTLARSITAGEQGRRIELRSPFPEFTVLSTALNIMVEKLEDASLVDALTGIANRRALDAHLELCDQVIASGGGPVSVAMVDIDHFKSFNDLFGHAAGDRALRDVGRALSRFAKRDGELAARYGGEEFVLVLTLDEPAEVASHLEAARQAVEALDIAHPASRFGRVTISIGYALVTENMTLKTAVEHADRALYAAKAAGRNQVRCDERETAAG